MNVKDDDNLIIIPKPDYISWEDITKLLNLAFIERLEQGLSYLAASQGVSETIRRSKDGTCLVALYKGRLVGTITYKLRKRDKYNNRWYYDDTFITSGQLAVDPIMKKKGIGRKLQLFVENKAIEYGVGSVIKDTSKDAEVLVKWFNKTGFERVDFISHPNTNYYSIVFRKPLFGKLYHIFYRLLRYYYSKCKCIILRKPTGSLRFPFKIIRKYLW